MKPLIIMLLMQISFAISAASTHQGEYEQDDDEEALPYVQIQYAIDFKQLTDIALSQNRVIMLEVSASYCDYCDLLEEEFIKPMLRNDDYSAKVLIRKIDMDSYHPITGFSGDETTPEKFTRKLNVTLSPTILFFDGHGKEVSKRILGINSLDLYGGYIDDAIDNGLHRIKSQ